MVDFSAYEGPEKPDKNKNKDYSITENRLTPYFLKMEAENLRKKEEIQNPSDHIAKIKKSLEDAGFKVSLLSDMEKNGVIGSDSKNELDDYKRLKCLISALISILDEPMSRHTNEGYIDPKKLNRRALEAEFFSYSVDMYNIFRVIREEFPDIYELSELSRAKRPKKHIAYTKYLENNPPKLTDKLYLSMMSLFIRLRYFFFRR